MRLIGFVRANSDPNLVSAEKDAMKPLFKNLDAAGDKKVFRRYKDDNLIISNAGADLSINKEEDGVMNGAIAISKDSQAEYLNIEPIWQN